MRTVLWLSLVATGCASLSQTSGQSGMSSAQSGNSSAASGASSGQSANSSNTSGTSRTSAQSSNASNQSSVSSQQSSASSQQSSASSAQSNASSNASSGSSGQSANSSRTSSASVQSSADSSQATSSGTSGTPSSTIVVGSALLLGVAGGIISTVYSANQRRAAQLEGEQLRQLQRGPVPQPMPYKVEPIPLQPGIPGQPQPQPPPSPPPPPPPEFEPTPYPSSVQLEPSLDAMMLARDWLVANELQLKQDLALGAGPTIDDLAGIAGITPSRRAHFGRVLQRNRALLLAPHEVTPREAAVVMSHLGDLVMADPLLRLDAVAMLTKSRAVD